MNHSIITGRNIQKVLQESRSNYNRQGNISPQLAQSLYRDSRKAGVINFPIDPSILMYVSKGIGRAIHKYPEMMDSILTRYPQGEDDRLLLHEVAICHKFLEHLKPVSTRAQSAISPNTARHTIERWIAVNLPQTQTGCPNDSGYYLNGGEMIIAACLDFPYDSGRYIKWSGNPSTWRIGYRCQDLTKSAKRLKPLHLHREKHSMLSDLHFIDW